MLWGPREARAPGGSALNPWGSAWCCLQGRDLKGQLLGSGAACAKCSHGKLSRRLNFRMAWSTRDYEPLSSLC